MHVYADWALAYTLFWNGQGLQPLQLYKDHAMTHQLGKSHHRLASEVSIALCLKTEPTSSAVALQTVQGSRYDTPAG